MAGRGEDISDLEKIPTLYKQKKALILEVEDLKRKRNNATAKIAELKRERADASAEIKQVSEVNGKIKNLDQELFHVTDILEQALLKIPNIPDQTVPLGTSDSENEVIRKWGEIPSFKFVPKEHWEIGTNLEILDFTSAAKVAGSRFAMYRKNGSRLERSLLNFMLDIHVAEHGYEEIYPPSIVNEKSLIGTGQLPKFADDLFSIENTNYFLIPTQEVPITNIHADEIINYNLLPLKYVAYGPCFRSEAGSAGKDTRGIVRQHQFNKIELVQFVPEEDSSKSLEQIVQNVEKILQLLKLPFRVLNMCRGELGFTAAKKYDIEVWLPASKRYLEISSCSNFKDFQARRANIKYRRDHNAKPEFLHTLNGSGLAIGRTVVAILENYQQEDGTVIVPEVLRPYMGGLEVIK